MLTGQISSHALQRRARPDLVGGDALEHRVGADRDVAVGAEWRGHDRAAGGGHHLADLEHDLARVERLAGGVRRAHARAAAAHRAGVGVEQLLPREVLDDGRAERLELGLHQVRHRLHRALRAVVVAQVHVERRREHVAQHRGGQDHEEGDERHDVADPPDPVPVLQGLERRTVDELAQRVADEAPLLVVGGSLEGDAEHLGAEAGEPDGEERAEDQGVLGLGLDADPVRPLHVATHDRPHDAADEDDAGGVADERVGLVRAAVEELEVLGELVVDLEHGRDAEQDQEPEVDHRVHHAGGRIAQQRAHVDAGAEVAEATLGVLQRLCGASVPVRRVPSSSSGRRTGTHPRPTAPGSACRTSPAADRGR